MLIASEPVRKEDTMMADRRVLKTLLVIFSFCFLFVSAVKADPGVKFWAMDIGNYWVLNGVGTDSGGPWTYTRRFDVASIDTTTVPAVTTYKVTRSEDGVEDERDWYSFTSTEIRRWRTEFYSVDLAQWVTVTIDNGFKVGDMTQGPGGSWDDNCTGTFGGVAFTASVHSDVLAYENITTNLGTYKAYKIHRVITFLTGPTTGVVEDTTFHFVPSIGIIHYHRPPTGIDPEDQEEFLASMKISKPIFDRDSDTKADGKADIAIYDSSGGGWWIIPSSGDPAYGIGWGGTGFTPIPGDYDGDGITDIAIYQAGTGAWWIVPSSGVPAYGVGWGGTGFTPIPGDYDGDGKTDVAIYQASTGVWWIKPSSGAPAYGVGWGGAGFAPVPGDYDGDGKTDTAIYETSTGIWWIKPSSGISAYGMGWGGAGFTPVPGDYDGDGKTDTAIYETSTGIWWIKPSSGASAFGVGWGGTGFTPVPGDYDGDGRTDIAIYETSSGAWWLKPSSGASAYGIGWGGPGYVPVTK